MGNPTSITTEDPEPRPLGRAGSQGSQGTPRAAAALGGAAAARRVHDVVGHRRRGPQWPKEAPPTGMLLPGVLSELAFYYGACCLYPHLPPRWGKEG
jgi:hypothetical protein